MSIFSEGALSARNTKIEEILSSLQNTDPSYLQFEVPDLGGYLRGKLMPVRKGLSGAGSGVSSLMLSARSGDQLSFTPFSNPENAFPKIVAVGDLDTFVERPWIGGSPAILSDLYMEDGTPCQLSGRQILRRALELYSEKALTPKVAMEYEVYVYHADEQAIANGRYDELKPFGRGPDFYSVSRFPHFEELGGAFLERMDAIGVSVDAFHTEYGVGCFEFALGVTDALKAADNAVRAKLYFKQLCAEFGLVATFMPALGFPSAASCLGAHLNVSVWQGDKNAFFDESSREFSQLAKQFTAGVLDSLPDLHVLYRPWINSYRRFDADVWNPVNATWGHDNHTTALRAVTGALPQKQCRLEHRVAGADVNPYLAIAACLLAGMQGIEGEYSIPPAIEGDAGAASDAVPLQDNLRDATAALRESKFARRVFGELFVEHFAQMRDDEADDFDEQSAGASAFENTETTPWEFEHYFEWA